MYTQNLHAQDSYLKQRKNTQPAGIACLVADSLLRVPAPAESGAFPLCPAGKSEAQDIYSPMQSIHKFKPLKHFKYSRYFSTTPSCKMRLPYVPDPPNFTSASDNEIVERIKARRGARGLISLDRALLHSPPVANGWYMPPPTP